MIAAGPTRADADINRSVENNNWETSNKASLVFRRSKTYCRATRQEKRFRGGSCMVPCIGAVKFAKLPMDGYFKVVTSGAM